MNCPRCDAELVIAPSFPGGLGGALVRVDCPHPFCAAPLVARVASGRSPDLVLLTREAGALAAREQIANARDDSPPPFGAVAIAVGVAVTAVALELPPAAVAAVSVVAAVGSLAGRSILRRRAVARNTRLLLEALPHVANALEAKARGYRG